MLTAAAAAMAGNDTVRVKGTSLYIRLPKLPATMEITSFILAIPVKMPMGMPTAPMQRPSNRTELRSCFAVAPTDERIPNWCVRSFSEMVNALYIRKTDPIMMMAVTMPPTVYRSILNMLSSESPMKRRTLSFRI